MICLLYTIYKQGAIGLKMEGSNFTQNDAWTETHISRANIIEKLHNIEAEQALLGGLLINNDAYHKISDIITESAFFDPLHQRIYSASGKLILAGRQASPVTLKEYFDDEEPINGLTVPHYLARLAVCAISIIAMPDYAETIKGLFLRRKAVMAGEKLIASVLNTAQTPYRTAIDGALDDLDKLTDHGGRRQNTRASVAQSALEALEQMKSPVRDNTVTTGLKDLDKALGGGWPRGELTIVAARPSVGKSAFATSVALKAARQGNKVLFFSLEMSKKSLGARCISELAYTRDNPIPYSDILSGSVEQIHWDRLDNVMPVFNDIPLEIDDQRGLSMTNIKSRLRRYITQLDRDGRTPDLLIVDHIGKIKSEQYQGIRHLELGAITEELAVLAGDFNVAVVALCQLNRAVEGRDNKRPGLGDLRESGRIEEDANCVITLHRPGYYLERMKCDKIEEEEERLQGLERVKNVFEAAILKQRNGICRPVELWCHMASNSIGNKGRS